MRLLHKYYVFMHFNMYYSQEFKYCFLFILGRLPHPDVGEGLPLPTQQFGQPSEKRHETIPGKRLFLFSAITQALPLYRCSTR